MKLVNFAKNRCAGFIGFIGFVVFVFGLLGSSLVNPSWAFADEKLTPVLTWSIQMVSTGHRFVEGPAVSPEGQIYFSDIPDHEIWIFDPQTQQTRLFQDDSHASNGLLFDQQGHLYACQGKGDRNVVVYLDPQDVKSRQSLVDQWEGQRLNSPNDLVIYHEDSSVSGPTLVFTDPRYGNRDDMQMDHESVYVVTGCQGLNDDAKVKVTRLNHHFVRPNGIVASPDGSRVYIADNGSVELWVWRTDQPAEQAELEKLIVVDPKRGGMDGMCVDQSGRIYATIPGLQAVSIISPEGIEIARLPIPERPTNCTLTSDEKTLYVTAQKSLYAVEVGQLPEID